MVSATQVDTHWAWLRRIMQKGHPGRTCRHFALISGITFLIVHNLVTIYDRYWESHEITMIQRELPRCFINKDQIDASETEKPVCTTSR